MVERWAYDATTMILRQSIRTHYEAPFMGLLVGGARAMLIDSGTGDADVRGAVHALIGDAELVVAHSHAHADHVGGDASFGERPRTTIVGHSRSDVARAFAMERGRGAIERTFNVDLVNNTTGAAGGDGLIDSSGANYINIPSPLTSRDNNRQAASDLNVLSKSIRNLDFDGVAGADIDPARVHLVGLSLGAMTGIIAADHTAFSTASVSAPGGLITQLLLESIMPGSRVVERR